MTVAQTVFVGIVAAIFGFYFQFRSWRHQNFESIRSKEKAAAIALVADLAEEIDQRLTLQRKFIAHLRDNRPEDEKINYRIMLDSWNGKHSSRFARTQHIFDKSFAVEFQQNVHDPLQKNNAVAERAIRLGISNLSENHKKETSEISRDFNAAQAKIKRWLMEANTRIANGELGQTTVINNINSNDPSMITRTYLIRRLLNLSVSKL